MSQPHACRAHRIRQLVWACESLASADDLKRLLDLGEPFADPGVAEFGLENAVFAMEGYDKYCYDEPSTLCLLGGLCASAAKSYSSETGRSCVDDLRVIAETSHSWF